MRREANAGDSGPLGPEPDVASGPGDATASDGFAFGADPLHDTIGEVELERMRASLERRLFQRSSASSPSLGRFELLGKLGKGGMGTVYAARDPQLNRSVAVKIVRSEQRGSRALRRMVREARALAQLSHPNIVQVYDVGVTGGEFFIAMEHLEGPTLRQWLSEESRKPREVLELMAQIGRGLAAAHAAGVIHRDLKPENIIISRGRPCIVDFGLADQPYRIWPTLESSSSLRITTADGETPFIDHPEPREHDEPDEEAMLGTPAYMAPEQLLGYRVDARADQFTFCVVLYEALLGRRPFDGVTITEQRQQLRDARTPAIGRALPRRLRRVLLRGLSIRADHRFTNMGALLSALDRARRPRTIPIVAATALSCAALSLGAWTLAHRSIEPRCSALPTAPLAPEEPQLERWQERWSSSVADACQAQRMDLLDCLEGRKQELLAALDELKSIADPQVRASALEHIDPECREPTSRAKIRGAIRFARLRARVLAGNLSGARGKAEALLAEAQRTSDRELERDVALLLGELDAMAGEFVSAESHDQAAYFAAAELGDHAHATMAANRLADLLSRQVARQDDAEHWLDKAGHHAARSRPTRLRLTLTKASCALHSGRLGQAEVLLAELDEPATTERERATVALLHAQLALSRGQLALARTRSVEALERMSLAVGDPSSPELAQAQTLLASVLAEQGDIQQAVDLLEAVVANLEAAFGPNNVRAAQTKLALAELRLTEQRPKIARRLAEEAHDVLADDPTRAHLVSSTLAHIDMFMGEHDLAIEHLRQAQKLNTPLLGPAEPRTVRDEALLAVALARRGILDEALIRARAAHTSARGSEVTQPALLAATSAALGETLLRRGELDEAQRLLQQAIDLRPRAADIMQAERAMLLAQALVEREPERAMASARQALALYRAHHFSPRAAEIVRWLSEHAPDE